MSDHRRDELAFSQDGNSLGAVFNAVWLVFGIVFFFSSLMPYGGIMRRVRVGVKVHGGEVEVINRFL